MRAYRNNEYMEFIAMYDKHGWILADSPSGGVLNIYKIVTMRFREEIDYFNVNVNGTNYTLSEMYQKFKFYNPLNKSSYKIGK